MSHDLGSSSGAVAAALTWCLHIRIIVNCIIITRKVVRYWVALTFYAPRAPPCSATRHWTIYKTLLAAEWMTPFPSLATTTCLMMLGLNVMHVSLITLLMLLRVHSISRVQGTPRVQAGWIRPLFCLCSSLYFVSRWDCESWGIEVINLWVGHNLSYIHLSFESLHTKVAKTLVMTLRSRQSVVTDPQLCCTGFF